VTPRTKSPMRRAPGKVTSSKEAIRFVNAASNTYGAISSTSPDTARVGIVSPSISAQQDLSRTRENAAPAVDGECETKRKLGRR